MLELKRMIYYKDVDKMMNFINGSNSDKKMEVLNLVYPTHDDASSDRTHHTTSPFMCFRLKSSFVNGSKLFHNVNIKFMSFEVCHRT
ncbi:hypothetical protein Hanom_Chr00s197548g01837101 [Helianthus anomalus]